MLRTAAAQGAPKPHESAPHSSRLTFGANRRRGMGIVDDVLLAVVMGAAMTGLAVTWWLWTVR
jgi:hypothetical protein